MCWLLLVLLFQCVCPALSHPHHHHQETKANHHILHNLTARHQTAATHNNKKHHGKKKILEEEVETRAPMGFLSPKSLAQIAYEDILNRESGEKVAREDREFDQLVDSLVAETRMPRGCVESFLLHTEPVPCGVQVEQLRVRIMEEETSSHPPWSILEEVGSPTTAVTPQNIHKGEFEHVSHMLMSLPFSTDYTKYLPLIVALVTSAFIAEVHVDISNNDNDFDEFQEFYKQRIRGGLNGQDGLLDYYRCYENPAEICIGNREGLVSHWAARIDSAVMVTNHDNSRCQTKDGNGHANHALCGYCTGSIWMRDYGPLTTCPVGDNPEMHTAFLYHPDLRIHDNLFPETFILDKYGSSTFTRLQIFAEGGNIQTNGRICLCSQHMVSETFARNGRLANTELLVRHELTRRLGCVQTFFVPNLLYENTHHVDMYLTWLNPRALIAGQYRIAGQDDANKAQIQKVLEAIQANTGIVPVEIPMPSRCPLNELPMHFHTLVTLRGANPAMVADFLAFTGIDPAVKATYDKGTPARMVNDLETLLRENGVDAFLERLFHPQAITALCLKRFVRLSKNQQIHLVVKQGSRLSHEILDKMHSGYGTRLACPELQVYFRKLPQGIMPAFLSQHFVYRSYTNGLIMNRIYVMPIYEQLASGGDVTVHQQHMMEAIATILNIDGVDDVVTGYADAQIAAQGAAHCTTQTIRTC